VVPNLPARIGRKTPASSQVVLLALVLLVFPAAPAGAACEITGPSMLDLYLSGRNLGDAVRSPGQPDAVLDASLTRLNTQIWGLYWVSLYSRRLREVLDQLDKPPGAVTRYYQRWDASQLATSAALTMKELAVADEALRAAQGLTPERAQTLGSYLERVRREVRDCASASTN